MLAGGHATFATFRARASQSSRRKGRDEVVRASVCGAGAMGLALLVLVAGLGRHAVFQEVAAQEVAPEEQPAPEAAAPPVELIAGGNFDAPATEWNGFPLSNGQLCVDVPGGTVNPWDVSVGQPGVPIVAGETYELSFEASSLPRSVTVRALVQLPAAPFTTALDRNPVLTGASQRFSYTFRAATSMTAAVSLQIGGAS